MLVPDEVRKSVVFIAYRPPGYEEGRLKLAGTGFFIGATIQGTDRALNYVVTARHVIDGIRLASIDGKVYVRVNSASGPPVIAATSLEDWCLHPGGVSVDVAVTPLALDADYIVIGLDTFVTDAALSSESIGVGDEVFLTGLFVNHYGRLRNTPVVRTGTIALMPEEPIESQLGLIDAYLIEARSVGGLSGSPVFVHIAPAVRWRREPVKEIQFGTKFYLLGLMHGHWETSSAGRGDQLDALPETERLNVGIAIVVPAQKILDTLAQPRIEQWRTATEAEVRAAKAESRRPSLISLPR